MGQDSIRYLLFLCGRWRWRPTRTMRKYGFRLITFGRELTPADKARAIALNDEWDKVRAGQQPLAQAEAAYAPGTIGHGYERAVKLRAAQWASQGIKRTAEQAKRDDWSRAWRWLGPTFGDARPHDIRPEHFLSLNTHGEAIGLLPKIEARVSKTERHRVVKVWRALWKKLATFGCVPDGMKDPSLAFSNTAPEPRQAVWAHREVMLLVQRAWRMEYRGLAALIAVSWDTMLSPVDARGLASGQRDGNVFYLGRAKTGRAAAGTLSKWSQALLDHYLATLGLELHANAPIFRTQGSSPGPKGGRRWAPRPYTTSKLDRDFRIVRAAVFGPSENRQLADLRRSGAVEADAGGASGPDLSAKMANTIGASNRLRKTYTPVNLASVRRTDEAREEGRRLLEQRPTKSVIKPSGGVS